MSMLLHGSIAFVQAKLLLSLPCTAKISLWRAVPRQNNIALTKDACCIWSAWSLHMMTTLDKHSADVGVTTDTASSQLYMHCDCAWGQLSKLSALTKHSAAESVCSICSIVALAADATNTLSCCSFQVSRSTYHDCNYSLPDAFRWIALPNMTAYRITMSP